MDLYRGKWYKKYINCPEDKRDYDFMKRGYSEKKAKLAAVYCDKFNVPDITETEKREIDKYWQQYGFVLEDYSWHRMYYYVTGKHDPRFVPDLVAGLCVYKYYNDDVYENTWRDKNMFSRLLPGVPMPVTICKRIRGRYFSNRGGYYSDANAVRLLSEEVSAYAMKNDSDIIVKKSRDTGFGKDVKKYSIHSDEDAINVFSEWNAVQDFCIQACVKQHPIFASFNEKSTNMMRIYSWRHGNEVDILFATVRAGIDDSITDISFVNGEELVHLVGISKDGVFSDRMLDQYGRVVKDLPSGVKVPSWNQIQDIIKKNHLLIDNFDIIGWDFTVDEDEMPICFEWNIQWPGTVFYQYVNGPLWGDKTDDILSFLKDENNQYNYIPFYMRKK